MIEKIYINEDTRKVLESHIGAHLADAVMIADKVNEIIDYINKIESKKKWKKIYDDTTNEAERDIHQGI